MVDETLRDKIFRVVCAGIGFDPEEEDGFMIEDYTNMAWNIVDEVIDVPEIAGLVK